MIARRKVLIGLAVLYPALARAQPAKPRSKPARVAMLYTGDETTTQARNKIFMDTLRELGWNEGSNIVYDRVRADGEARLRELAAELIARGPDVVLVSTNAEVRAVLATTRTIPIVFSGLNDPVRSGLVKSLARPGGNLTGVANIGPELGPKRLQLIKEIMPKATRIGLLVTPVIAPMQVERKLIEEAAGRHLKIVPATVNEAEDLETAFRLLVESRVEAVLTTHIQLYVRLRKGILDLAARYRLPVVGHRGVLAENGALMSYSSVLSEQIRRSAYLVDKILKGTRPADIPVEQPTKFELVVNMKTAKTLGIKIPQSIMLQATRVIE